MNLDKSFRLRISHIYQGRSFNRQDLGTEMESEYSATNFSSHNNSGTVSHIQAVAPDLRRQLVNVQEDQVLY
jgi:hypothetical protein